MSTPRDDPKTENWETLHSTAEHSQLGHGRGLSRAARSPSLFAATLLVARKELLGSFRDRQTTLYTIVLPIALYPFIFWAMIQGALFVQGRQEHTDVRIGVAATSAARLPFGIQTALAAEPESSPHDESEAAPRKTRTDIHRMQVDLSQRPLDEALARAWLHAPEDRELLDDRHDDEIARAPDVGRTQTPERPDAVLLLRATPESGDDISAEETKARLFYDSTESRSSIAKKRVEKRMPAYAEKLRRDRAAEARRDPRELEPFQVDEPKDMAEEARGGAFLLSLILPMLLVVMTVIGAFYPAVDLTAGERERNTIETTMLLPVPRLAVHQGKILAVCAGAILATTLNLLALALSAGHLVNMLREGRTIQIALPLGAFLAITPLAILFAFFVSALLTGIAALARTFKEGQALLGPVQMLFMFPAMAGAIPGLELTPKLALVPIVNVVLAFRALLKGQSLPLEYTLTAASLLVLALASIWLALRILSRESLIAADKSFALSDIVRVWRSKGGSR